MFVVKYSFIAVLALLLASPAQAWTDADQGHHWLLKNGRFPANDIDHECAIASSAGFRTPEKEELAAAIANGLLDPSVNEGFAAYLLERHTHLYTRSSPPDQADLRYVYNIETGEFELINRRARGWRGLVCLMVPGRYRYWYDEEQDIHFYRGRGRSGNGAARSTCSSHLNDRWVSTITELEQAYGNGLFDPEINTVHGAALASYDIVMSSTPLGGDDEQRWALNVQTGARMAVPRLAQHYYVCSQIFD